jgi:hypothetical protein
MSFFFLSHVHHPWASHTPSMNTCQLTLYVGSSLGLPCAMYSCVGSNCERDHVLALHLRKELWSLIQFVAEITPWRAFN